MGERLSKEMHMIGLDIERPYRPGVGFTDAANFLFHKRSKLANQNLLAVFGTPDKVISQFIGDVFGVLCSNPLPMSGRSADPKCSNG
jgi:hypothetical protein